MNVNERLLLTAVLLAWAASGAQAANICGALENGNGPFDYRKAASEHLALLKLVEGAHFTEEVEQGIRGNRGTLGNDLDYTLRAFPNHVRALAAMARVAMKEKKIQLSGAKYPAECYFDRAIRFAPDDGAVRATYGGYLFARGQTDAALTMFSVAAQLNPDNATINYNLGLAHLKKKNYEQANLYAHKAYALGFPLPGLKNLLLAAGKWDDKVDIQTQVNSREGKADENPQ